MAPQYFVLVGETGSGKSTFINLLAGEPVAQVNHGLSACTRRVTPYKLRVVDWSGEQRWVTIIDTPGLNNPRRPDSDIMQDIRVYLASLEEDAEFAALMLFQALEDRPTSSLRFPPDFDFANLALLATTSNPLLERRPFMVQRLRRGYWEGWLERGATMWEVEETTESACAVMRELLSRKPATKKTFLRVFSQRTGADGAMSKRRGFLFRLFGIF